MKVAQLQFDPLQQIAIFGVFHSKVDKKENVGRLTRRAPAPQRFVGQWK